MLASAFFRNSSRSAIHFSYSARLASTSAIRSRSLFSAFSSSLSCHASRASTAGSATLLQNCATSFSDGAAAAAGGAGFGGAVALPRLAGRAGGGGLSGAGTSPVVRGAASSAAQAAALMESMSPGSCATGGGSFRAPARAKESRLSGFGRFASSSASAGEVLASADSAISSRNWVLLYCFNIGLRAILGRELSIERPSLHDACASLDDHFRLQRAGCLDRLQDRNDAGRLQADLVKPADQTLQVDAAEDRDLSSGFVGLDDCLWNDHRLALREWSRLGHDRKLCHADRQIPVRHRDRRDPHVSSDHHRAGALIDHHACGRIRLDGEFAAFSEEAHWADVAGLGQHDGPVVALKGDLGPIAATGIAIDGVEDSGRCDEIGVLEFKDEEFHLMETSLHLALDKRTVRNATGGWRSLADALRLALHAIAGDRHGPL